MRGIDLHSDWSWSNAPRKGSSGGGQNTVVQQSGPPAQVLASLQNLTNQATSIGQQPYPSYNSPLVAGFNPEQQSAFANINQAAFAASPFINAASQDATNATNLLSPQNFGSTIQSYQDPYTQQVVNATQAEFNNQNAQQQAQVQGNAISSGAWGGDRSAVAQALTAQQQQLAQAPVIANLNNQGFQTAINAAQGNAWLNSQGAFALGQLGSEAQQTGLAGANAQLGAGNMQQQLAQQQLNVPYQQYLAAQGYPYQTTNWQAGIETGLGGAQGGTSSTTSPAPSALSQAAGLGLSGAGALGLTGAFGSNGWLTGAGGLFGAGTAASLGAGAYSADAAAAIAAGAGVADVGAGALGTGAALGLAASGGRIERAPGGPVMSGGPFGAEVPHMGHGLGIPRPPTPQPGDGLDLGGLGELANIARTGRGTVEAHGGRVTGLDLFPQHFDDGGLATAAQVAPNSGAAAMFGGNPLLTQNFQQYQQLPTEKLQEAAVRIPPNSPQGQMIQRALMQRRMQPQADPGQTQPLQAAPQLSNLQAPGGLGGQPQGFALGGGPSDYVPTTDDWTNNPNGGMPMPGSAANLQDSQDTGASTAWMAPVTAATETQSVPAPPSLSSSSNGTSGMGERVWNNLPSPPAGNLLAGDGGLGSLPTSFPTDQGDQGGLGTGTGDTGEPMPYSGRVGSQPMADTGRRDSGLLSSPESLLAMGLGILGGRSPFASVNIGQGALAGMKFAQSMPDYRMHQIQAEQAQENLDALRQLRSNVGLGAGSPGAARAPDVQGGLGAGTTTSGQAGTALSGGTQNISAVSSQDGTPLFNIGQEYSNAQAMMMSGLPAYVDAGKAKLEFLNNLVKEGIVPTSSGGVVPLSGYAEAAARKAGLVAQTEAPYKIGEELASRAAMPLKLEPGETATTGAAALPPEFKSLMSGVAGIGGGNGGGQTTPQAAPSSYAARVASIESPTGAANGNHAGVGQFDPQTWLSTVRSAFPQAANMTDAQLLPLRGSKSLSLAMIDQNAKRNAPALADAGLPVNQSSAYLAHWFGPQGAIRLAQAPANAPISTIFPPDLVAQNGLQGKTAGQVIQGVVSRFGTAPIGGQRPGGTQYAQGATPVSDATPQGKTSFQPSGPAIPGMINVTHAPPDLPPSQNLAAPTIVQNSNGSITSSLNPYTKAIQTKYANDVGAIPDEIQKLNNTQLLLTGLHDEVQKNAAQPGWYQSGAGADWRQAIAKGANAASAALGGNPVFDPNAVANTEQFNKNSNVAAFSLARTMAGGRVALGEVLQANRSVPNMANTPFGNVVVTQLLLQDNVHQTDRLRYQAEQAAKGVDPIASGRVFDQYNPVRNYVSAAAAGAVAEAYPQVIAALKSAPTVANIEAFNRKFGDGSAQVLLSGQ